MHFRDSKEITFENGQLGVCTVRLKTVIRELHSSYNFAGELRTWDEKSKKMTIDR